MFDVGRFKVCLDIWMLCVDPLWGSCVEVLREGWVQGEKLKYTQLSLSWQML